MISRNDLPELLYNTIKELGGKADMMTIFKKFYHDNEQLLKKSGDLFYTWNYDIRWAATKLRKKNKMRPARQWENTYGADISSRGILEIIE